MRRVAIKDNEGNVLGHFKAPDGATADEIEEHAALFRETLEAKAQAARESERTEPSTDDPICGVCRQEVPPRELVAHVNEHADQLGVDLDS